MFKIFNQQNDFTSELTISNRSIDSVTKSQNIQSQQLQNANFLQFSLHQTFESQTETVQSRKSLIKKNLKNSLILPKVVSIMNFKQDQLTAASLKDLQLDFEPHQKLKTNSLKQNNFSYLSSFSSIQNMNQNIQIFNENFEILQVIGQGAHSIVYKCLRKFDSKIYALKKMKNISLQNWKKIKNFFFMMKNIHHLNILEYHEIYFSLQKSTAYVIIQYCQYTDLRFQIKRRLQKQQKFKDQEIIQILIQILQALKYLHQEGICHRDLKPENILYNRLNSQIKIIDLDVCGVKKYRSQTFDLWTNTGTLFYKAPETFGIGYNQKVDIWSIGIIAYQLIVGKTPFETQYEKDFLQKILNVQINYQRISSTKKLQQFLKMSLKKNKNQRANATELINFLNSKKIDKNYCIKKLKQNKIRQQKYNFFEQQDKDIICLGNLLKFSFQ